MNQIIDRSVVYGWACVDRAHPTGETMCISHAPLRQTAMDKVREFGPSYELAYGLYRFEGNAFEEMGAPKG